MPPMIKFIMSYKASAVQEFLSGRGWGGGGGGSRPDIVGTMVLLQRKLLFPKDPVGEGRGGGGGANANFYRNP